MYMRDAFLSAIVTLLLLTVAVASIPAGSNYCPCNGGAGSGDRSSYRAYVISIIHHNNQ